MKRILDYRNFLNSKLIKEGSFFNYNIDNILTDEYIKKWIKEEDMASIYLENFIDYNRIDTYDDNFNEDEIRNSSEFHEHIKNELERHLEEAIYNISSCIEDGKITLWRAITVDDNWLKHLEVKGKRLGIYWTWNEKSADTHWGNFDKKHTAIIETEVDENMIDWKDTISMNMHPNFNEEKEIRLFKNTPIKINSIEFNGKDIDISNIKNKTFLA